jgi:3alpha(or 20beta)-hydroxysteroid dehydrogenase
VAVLSGKVAIITGASRGQGLAEAIMFAKEGAKVVLTDVIDDGAAEAEKIGDQAFFMKQDVADEAQWDAVTKATLDRFGRIDILVNNAGVYKPGAVQDTTSDAIDWHYRINQLSVFLGMKAVIEPMKSAGGGAIVNIASGAALRGVPAMFAYAGSKWAVRGMSRCAAVDLAPLGIRVNTIFPGLIDTPMLDCNPPEQMEAMRRMVPMDRLGTTDEIAATALFLASDGASYISGAEITVCGAINV